MLIDAMKTIPECFYSALFRDFDITHSPSDVLLYVVPETWGDTALGMGGMGGQVITTAHTTIVESLMYDRILIYRGSKLYIKLSKKDLNPGGAYYRLLKRESKVFSPFDFRPFYNPLEIVLNSVYSAIFIHLKPIQYSRRMPNEKESTVQTRPHFSDEIRVYVIPEFLKHPTEKIASHTVIVESTHTFEFLVYQDGELERRIERRDVDGNFPWMDLISGKILRRTL